jgi:hypothetical protein
VTGPLNSQPTCALEYRHIGVRSSEIPFADVASSNFLIGRTPIEREKVNVDSRRSSGNREETNTRP